MRLLGRAAEGGEGAMPAGARLRGEGTSFGRLRWVAIAVPLAGLVFLDYLRHRVFYPEIHDYPGVIGFFGLIAVGVTAFSFVIFAVIERLERRVLEQNTQLSALNEIAAASGESFELDELLNVALDKVLATMKAEAGVICLLDLDTEELVAACYRGFSDELAQRIKRQKLGDEPVGTRAVTTGRPVVVERLLEMPDMAEAARREGLLSAVSVPLKSEGEVSGVLGVATRHERRFDPQDLSLLTAIGAQLGLAVRNAVLFEKAQQRNRELEALLAVGRAISSSLGLPAMLDRALDAILAVTSAESAEVWLAEEGRELALQRHRGAAPERFGERTRLRFGEGLPGVAAEAGAPVVVHDLASDPRFVRDDVKEAGYQTFCALPLMRGGEVVGVLGVAARDREALSRPAELRLLQAIGEQVAVAVDNARLHEKVLDVAVLEERERISRELHDGLAQVLGYVNTQALAIRKLLRSGRTAEAEVAVAAIEEAARELYTDIREAVVGLRAPLAGGLIPALRTYVDRYREMTGVAVDFEADGAAETLRLPGSVEIQVMRIVQEALTNVRKHARTSRAHVRVAEGPDGLTLTVSDEGQGFDLGRLGPTGWPRFGLQTMRERADAFRGDLEVASTPGRGTAVTVRVPSRQAAEMLDESLAG